MSRTAIKPFEPVAATEEERAIARANCAARSRARGREDLAAAFEFGSQDEGFAMKHEVYRLRAEQGGAE